MRIQHNIMAMNAYRNYNTNTSALSKNLEKLSSGYKINRAGDDAAGLAISEKMRAQITGLNTAQKNVKDGISLVKTAEGAMQEVQDMLNRMVDLATQSANGTYQDEVDREALQAEIDQLNSEIDRIADSANFNGIKLLDGSLSRTGGKGAITKFTVGGNLPGVGTEQRTNTVLHTDPNQSENGTSFNVDLHSLKIHDGAGAKFTLEIGKDIKIELTGLATTASAATAYDGDAIVAALTGGSSILDKFNISINGASVAGSTTFEFGTDGITIKNLVTEAGQKIGDVKISAGTSGGDARLKFTQLKSPTKEEEIWKPASEVKGTVDVEKATVAPKATQSLNYDDQIQTLTSDVVSYTEGRVTFGTAVLKPGNASIAGTTATASMASKALGVTGLKVAAGSITLTASKVLTAAATKGGAVSIKVDGSKVGLFVGDTKISTSTESIASMSANGKATFTFGTIGKIVITATAAATKATIMAGTGAINTGLTIDQNAGAVTGAVSAVGSGATFLYDTLKGKGATDGDIELKRGTGSIWTLGVGTNTIDVRVTATGTVKSAATNGATYFKITLGSASVGSIASTIKVGTYTAPTTDDPNKPAGLGSSVGDTGKAVVDAIASKNGITIASDGAVTIASDSYFKSGEVLTADPVAIASIVPASFATKIAAATKGSASVGVAMATRTITIDGLGSVTLSAISATTTVDDALAQILADINKAAADKAKADYAALGSAAGSITVNYDFKFENAAGSIVAQAGGNPFDGLKLTYKTLKLSNQSKDPVQPGNSAAFKSYDFNVSTTDINRVGMDGKERLASTLFELKESQVSNGAEIKIGDKTYNFSTDKADKGDDGKGIAGKTVYIGDLMEDGVWKKGGFEEAMERLTHIAANNDVYTVGFDGKNISVTERQDYKAKYVKDFDLTTEEGIEKSLGFTAAGAQAANGGKGLTLQIGDTSEDFNQLSVEIKDIHASALGVGNLSIATQQDAADAINTIKNAINYVSSVRGTLGATQNRLEHTQNNLSVMAENIQDAESSIRDTDIAEEMMAYTKNNILVQSAQAMLAQANQVPQGVLQLLG